MWISKQLLFCIILLYLCEGISGKCIKRRCARLYSSEAHFLSDDEPDTSRTSDDSTPDIEVCQQGFNSCYTLWEDRKLENNITSMVIIAQGCWGAGGCSSASDGCQSDAKPSRARKNTRFCCCSTDLCNMNVTVSESKSVIQQPTPSSKKEIQSSSDNWIFLALIVSLMGFLFGFFCLSVYIDAKLSPKTPSNPLTPKFPVYSKRRQPLWSNLRLEKVIGRGKYGTLWLSKRKHDQVAVKVYPSQYSHYYFNEKDIYTLPFMIHPNLVMYFGSDELVDGNGHLSYMLVLSYCPLGPLMLYLNDNILDLATFTSMALSIAAGLAHLHTEIRKGDKWKPCIGHRDLNTRNILVKSDLSCCICDLGLAVKIAGSKYYTLGEEQNAMTKSINDVGTLRYMAPEILEGAVNLRDCESSLKQIDVYALGVVLWELATRTADFYSKPGDVVSYTFPFEENVKSLLNIDEIQLFVFRDQDSLTWPSKLKTPYGQLVKETVDDCMDQDAEARLTALCVYERISVIKSSLGAPHLAPPSPTQYDPLHTPVISKKNAVEEYSEPTSETIISMSPREGPQLTSAFSNLKDNTDRSEYMGRILPLDRNFMMSTTDSSEEVIHTSCKDSKSIEKKSLIKNACYSRANHSIPYLQNRPFSGNNNNTADDKVSQNDKRSTLSTIFTKPLKHILKKKKQHPIILPPIKTEKVAERPSSLELEPRKPLKELSCRVKTPGDLPPSVRKKRARFSLYDDRIMSSTSRSPQPPPLKPFDSSF